MVLAAILGPSVQAVELDQQCSVVEQHCNENPIYVRGIPRKGIVQSQSKFQH